jgi:hypothetical protein
MYTVIHLLLTYLEMCGGSDEMHRDATVNRLLVKTTVDRF